MVENCKIDDYFLPKYESSELSKILMFFKGEGGRRKFEPNICLRSWEIARS